MPSRAHIPTAPGGDRQERRILGQGGVRQGPEIQSKERREKEKKELAELRTQTKEAEQEKMALKKALKNIKAEVTKEKSKQATMHGMAVEEDINRWCQRPS